jgi:hypothetical protein
MSGSSKPVIQFTLTFKPSESVTEEQRSMFLRTLEEQGNLLNATITAVNPETVQDERREYFGRSLEE